MKITFVTKDADKPEKWKILELKEKGQNPFIKNTKEGETIPDEDLIKCVTSPYYEPGGAFRKIQKFCLLATLAGYRDIRYYWEHGQS